MEAGPDERSLLGEGGIGQGEGCCFPAEGTLGGSVLETRLNCTESSAQSGLHMAAGRLRWRHRQSEPRCEPEENHPA